jgi:hypothetical protein
MASNHPLTPEIVTLVDELRSRGQNYDQVVTGLAHHGVPAGDVESVLKRYRRVTDQQGRPRDQINPGDPHATEPGL